MSSQMLFCFFPNLWHRMKWYMHSSQMRKPVGRSRQDMLKLVLNFGVFLSVLKAIPDLQHLAFLYSVDDQLIAFSPCLAVLTDFLSLINFAYFLIT